MELLQHLFDTLIHFSPEKVNELTSYLGSGLYVVVFAIIFAETGLVVTPFLPGDSLLFAVGAVAAAPGSPINLPMMAVLVVVAAILGDAVNYAVGYWVGPKVFTSEKSRLLNRKHLFRAQEFYDKHGGKMIILARFVPIVRTFAPFVAGIGRMSYWKFALYNITGGAVWACLFLFAGFWFGSNELVKKQFHLVIFGIIFVSILPGLWEIARARLAARKGESELLASTSLEDTPAP